MDDLMTGWSVDVLGVPDEADSRDVRCGDTAELARVVGVAAALSKAAVIVIRRADDGSPLPVVSIDDPIETGREAALGQWEERWRAMRATAHWFIDTQPDGQRHAVTVGSILTEMNKIEKQYPTGSVTLTTGVEAGEPPTDYPAAHASWPAASSGTPVAEQ